MFWVFVGFGLLASAISVNKVILQSIPLVFFVGIRMLCAGVLLCLLYYKKSPRLSLANLRRDLGTLTFIALCTTFFPSLLKAYGLKYLLSSKAAFIGALDPFVTALYSYMLWSERLSFKKVLGIFLGFLGTVYLCLPQGFASGTMYDFLIISLPEFGAFGSVAIGRYGWICAQKVLRQDRYSPPELNGIIMLISGLLALTVSVFMNDYSIQHLSWNLPFCLMFIYTVVVGNVIAYTMYAHFLKAYSASFVSLAGFSVPIFVSTYGFLFLGEPITTKLLVAAAVIFLGVYTFYRDEIKTY